MAQGCGNTAAGCVGFFILVIVGVGLLGTMFHPASSTNAPSADTSAPAYTPPSTTAPSQAAMMENIMRRSDALVHGRGADWLAAEDGERTGAAAIMAIRMGADKGWSVRQRGAVSSYLLDCLNAFYEGDQFSSQPVVDIAAACEVMRESEQR